MNKLTSTTSGKTVLITGATSGIGLALYNLYIHLGYQVITCGRDKQKLAQLTPQARKKLVFDVNDINQVAKAAEQLIHIDLLILNAGTCLYINNAKEFDGASFREVINTNLVAMGTLLEKFLPMVPAGGHLALISSSATILPFSRAEAYGASKAGVDYLANSLRGDLVGEHIGVSLIHPGFVKTPLTDKNNFSMPFLLTAEQAAQRIYQGIKRRKKYVHFPKRLTLLLRLLAFLPQSLCHSLLRKDKKQ
ncbi:MAG: SDR family NAD(P)-dependent oxidoreductase [Colwellia sp.]|nr:SDR family NAD(P)-dependent oxidoreductase [Colwellia sp.]